LGILSPTLAKDVYLLVDNDINEVVFSDNFFDLYPGEEKVISYTPKNNKDKDILPDIQIFNIHDSHL